VKDEGFFTAAGLRFVIFATLLIAGGVLAYFIAAEDVSIDLDELTGTSTTSTTEIEAPEVTVPEVTIPDVARDPYFRCIENAETAQDVIDCGNR
jgi:hypothetical protein